MMTNPDKRQYLNIPAICPSLLQCDFGRLAEEISVCEQNGAKCVHWDVMDGHFVPNLTYGPPVIKSLRYCSKIIYDAHLMMSNPERYLDQFLKAGCDIVTIHLEAVQSPRKLLQLIRAGGALAGLAINPPTSVESLQPWLDVVDLVLVMSVMPGFGGQAFDIRALAKLRWLKAHAHPNTLLQVDGGINRSTISSVVQAGAQLLVVGSAYFSASNRQSEFDSLRRLAR